jgi:hypothetical protein
MNKITEINHQCDFCGRKFLRETTIAKHLCESKRRWLDKDKHCNRIGYNAWVQFYDTQHINKKKKEYADFIKSAYYTAFVKFGLYCVNANVINVTRYVDWLLKNQIKIDSWNKDSNYTKFIIDHLKTEDPLDAIARSIETTLALAKKDGIPTKDVFKYGNKNSICFEITKGKISPWMLFHSNSGLSFIENLDVTQQKMILEYINPEQWAIKFKKQSNIINEIKELLNAGGY